MELMEPGPYAALRNVAEAGYDDALTGMPAEASRTQRHGDAALPFEADRRRTAPSARTR